MRAALRVRSTPLGLVTVMALAACGSRPVDLETPVAVAAPVSGAAATEAAPAAVRTLVVNASTPRTFVGHFLAGQRVRFSVLDTVWASEPGTVLFDAKGARWKACGAAKMVGCAKADAPMMGLVLLTVADMTGDPDARETSCHIRERMYVPDGIDIVVPTDMEIALGPNDATDELDDNSGALLVEVERVLGPNDQVVERRQVSVGATRQQTLAGRFAAGDGLRIKVLSGTWRSHPLRGAFGSRGDSTAHCAEYPRSACSGGSSQPLMGLILFVSPCDKEPQVETVRTRIKRGYIPEGGELVLDHDADVFLAPNDFTEGFPDNSGSAKVEVRTF